MGTLPEIASHLLVDKQTIRQRRKQEASRATSLVFKTTSRHFSVNMNLVLVLLVSINVFMVTDITYGKKDDSKPDWAKKDIRDYSDADLERLYEQWEEDEDPLEADELPEHKRPPPKLDLSNIDMSDPEGLLKISKKGKTVMVFVTVSGNPMRYETEELTGRWQTGLMNSHLIAERFVISEDRAIFMFKDGAHAWEAKDVLVDQDRCQEVTIENKPYPGKGSLAGKQEL